MNNETEIAQKKDYSLLVNQIYLYVKLGREQGTGVLNGLNRAKELNQHPVLDDLIEKYVYRPKKISVEEVRSIGQKNGITDKKELDLLVLSINNILTGQSPESYKEYVKKEFGISLPEITTEMKSDDWNTLFKLALKKDYLPKSLERRMISHQYS